MGFFCGRTLIAWPAHCINHFRVRAELVHIEAAVVLLLFREQGAVYVEIVVYYSGILSGSVSDADLTAVCASSLYSQKM